MEILKYKTNANESVQKSINTANKYDFIKYLNAGQDNADSCNPG